MLYNKNAIYIFKSLMYNHCIIDKKELKAMRNRIIEDIEKNKLIVIIRGVDREKLLPLAEALYKGGIRLIEVTFSADGSTDDAYTAENIRILSEAFRGRLRVGAGTVLTEEQVELTANAGGEFIISPDTYAPVIERTRALGMVSIPGAMTPSEIALAHRVGADFVKLFPVSGVGPKYVKAVTAPLSHVKLLAVGGINESNMKEYLSTGVKGFGIGNNLVDKRLLAENDYDGITALAEKYVQEVE